MLRGFYTAASGMLAQQRHQEALSNNIANANTPGFKADQATLRAFPELLIQKMGTQNLPTKQGHHIANRQAVGSLNTGVYVQEYVPNFSQGDIRETNMTTDVALINGQFPDEQGSVFFTVQNGDGELCYTRNGNFTVDSEGYLVTNQGYYVLNEAGNPIQTNGVDFTITPDGFVQADGNVEQLGIRYVANPTELTKEGNDLFSGQSEVVPQNASYEVRQGVLEQSNVDSMQTMTQMMEAFRVFETNQRVLKAFDESMGKAVNDIAKF